MAHFIKHWPADKVKEVKDAIRDRVSGSLFCSFLHIANSAAGSVLKFMERYNEKTSKTQPQAACVRKAVSPTKLGRHRNVDDTDSSDDEDCQQAINKGNAYLEEWNLYLNTHETVPDDIGIVRWWGVGLSLSFPDSNLKHGFQLYGGRYPTWQSLACDYLSVMASSVSSERAFSSAGITICKRCNCLDADIVESLQCLKSFIQQDLMAQDVVSIAEEEQELDDMDGQPMNQDTSAIDVVDAVDNLSWGAVSDNGGGGADAGGNDMDIEIV